MARKKKIYNASHRREKLQQPWDVRRLNRVAVVTVVALLACVSGIGALTAQPVHQPAAVDTSDADYPPPYTGVTVLKPAPVLPEVAPEPENLPPNLQLIAATQEENENVTQLQMQVQQLSTDLYEATGDITDAAARISALEMQVDGLKQTIVDLKSLLEDRQYAHEDEMTDLNTLITSLVDRISYLETVIADLLEPEPALETTVVP